MIRVCSHSPRPTNPPICTCARRWWWRRQRKCESVSGTHSLRHLAHGLHSQVLHNNTAVIEAAICVSVSYCFLPLRPVLVECNTRAACHYSNASLTQPRSSPEHSLTHPPAQPHSPIRCHASTLHGSPWPRLPSDRSIPLSRLTGALVDRRSCASTLLSS